MSIWDFLYNTTPAKPRTPREKVAAILEERHGISGAFSSLKWCKSSKIEDSGGYWETMGNVPWKITESRKIYIVSFYATMTECAKGFRLIENPEHSCLYGDCLAVPDNWEVKSYEIEWKRPKVLIEE